MAERLPPRRVGRNALARFAAQVWAKLLSLTLVALVARYEGTAGLGRYVWVVTIIGMVGAAVDLGLNTFLTREAARDVGTEQQHTLLDTILPLKLCLSLLGLIGLSLATIAAPLPEGTRTLLVLGGLSIVPDAATGAMGAFLNGRQRLDVTGLLSMAVRLVTVAAAFLALSRGHGVAGVLACTVGASLLGTLLHAIVLQRWGLLPRSRWDFTAWRAYLHESYPFALTSIIAVVYARMDLVLITLWQGEVAAGWYSAGYKLWETLGLIPSSVLDALFPEMSRLAGSQEGLRRLRDLFRTARWAMLAGGLVLAVAGALAAGGLVTLVYGGGEAYSPAVPVFRILVWALPAMFLYLLSGHVLYAVGQQRQVTKVMWGVGLVNVALNLLVIPRWSYLGACGVALFSEWLLWGLLYSQAKRTLNSATPGEPGRSTRSW